VGVPLVLRYVISPFFPVRRKRDNGSLQIGLPGRARTNIPRGVPFWIDWFEIPPYREMRDMCGRRVYTRSPGIHTVRFRTAKRKQEKMGKYRDFNPVNGG
jgi:hypothetical protein